MLRLFSFITITVLTVINVGLMLAIGVVLMVSEAKISWMSEHGMFKHEMAYVFICACLLISGVMALKDGWRLTKQCYEFSKG